MTWTPEEREKWRQKQSVTGYGETLQIEGRASEEVEIAERSPVEAPEPAEVAKNTDLPLVFLFKETLNLTNMIPPGKFTQTRQAELKAYLAIFELALKIETQRRHLKIEEIDEELSAMKDIKKEYIREISGAKKTRKNHTKRQG